MNERIRELSEQAREYAESKMQFTGVKDSAAYDEKFAELIVRECAKVANRAENAETEIRCMYDVITEHFGVEE